jgi:hypothetical protein
VDLDCKSLCIATLFSSLFVCCIQDGHVFW